MCVLATYVDAVAADCNSTDSAGADAVSTDCNSANSASADADSFERTTAYANTNSDDDVCTDMPRGRQLG